MSHVNARVDIRDYEPKDRYTTVSGTFKNLKSGERMEIINDHDVRPLFQYKLSADFPGEYDWEYIEEGPELWRALVIKK